MNAAWLTFARENGLPEGGGVGTNYLASGRSATNGSPEEGEQVCAGIEEVLSGKKDEFHHEYTCHSPWEKRWFMVRATHFSSNGRVLVVVAHENITDCKEMEAALREHERLLHTVINLVPHFIFAKDREGRHLLVNQA